LGGEKSRQRHFASGSSSTAWAPVALPEPLTGGDALGTVGGAAVGGVIGNQVGK
jgi:osmotically inducible lipoprotein OsmB